MEINIFDAIQSLRPGANYGVDLNTNEITWQDTEVLEPTTEEIQTELSKLQTEYTNLEYARNRKDEYLNIEDQLDMLYWDKINSTNTWAEHITSVKNKYPKG